MGGKFDVPESLLIRARRASTYILSVIGPKRMVAQRMLEKIVSEPDCRPLRQVKERLLPLLWIDEHQTYQRDLYHLISLLSIATRRSIQPAHLLNRLKRSRLLSVAMCNPSASTISSGPLRHSCLISKDLYPSSLPSIVTILQQHRPMIPSVLISRMVQGKFG